MMSDHESEHIAVLHNGYWDRRRWIVWAGFAFAAIIGAIAFAAFAVTAVQIIDRISRDDQRFRDQQECRAVFNAAVLKSEQLADSAEHGLFAATIRGIFNGPEGTSASEGDTLLNRADRIDELNLETDAAIAALNQYLDAGSPLPCPIQHGRSSVDAEPTD